MSIIHQALKKVQDKLSENSNQQPISAQQQINPQQRQWLRLVILILLPILTGGSIWFMLRQVQPVLKDNPSIQLPKISLPIVTTNTSQPKKQPPATVSSPNNTSTENPDSTDLLIQGIMMQGNSRIVLINNNIYQTGDLVNNMKILVINSDSIIVDNAGQQTTYKLNR